MSKPVYILKVFFKIFFAATFLRVIITISYNTPCVFLECKNYDGTTIGSGTSILYRVPRRLFTTSYDALWSHTMLRLFQEYGEHNGVPVSNMP